MKFLLVVAALIMGSQAVAFVDLIPEEWGAFKLQYGKQYDSEIEERFRMKILMENLHKVAKHNKLYEQGYVSYKLSINKYADLLHDEYIHTLNGFNMLLKINDTNDSFTFNPPAHIKVPEEVDWRGEGAVTDVKDQGYCRSCWSFSATGSLEGQHFRQTGELVSLSEQNLIDCSTIYGNAGCNGGLTDNAFRYIKANKGIDTDTAYPYHAQDQACNFQPQSIGATEKGFVDIESGSEEKLKLAVATIGPVSVAIDASHDSFHFYSEGVYYDLECGSDQLDLDHAVLVVGYGTDENDGDYWLVKNSWGTSWGEQGYIKMARNKENMCGIATQASYPLV